MILDNLLAFSVNQTITTTAVSTNIVDLNNARDIGVGDNPAMKIAIFVGTAFTSTAAATLQIQAQGSTDSTTWVTYAESRAYSIANLGAGDKLFPIDWPAIIDDDPLPRYIRLNYVGGVATLTTGALSAYLVLDRQDWRSYPAGLTVAN